MLHGFWLFDDGQERGYGFLPFLYRGGSLLFRSVHANSACIFATSAFSLSMNFTADRNIERTPSIFDELSMVVFCWSVGRDWSPSPRPSKNPSFIVFILDRRFLLSIGYLKTNLMFGVTVLYTSKYRFRVNSISNKLKKILRVELYMLGRNKKPKALVELHTAWK